MSASPTEPSRPAARSRPPKKRRDKNESKRRLVEAAIEIFSKEGYDAATTKLIAGRAGLNESLITRYFDGKHGLLLATVAAFVQRQEALQMPHPVAANLEKEIYNFFEWRLSHYEKEHALVSVVVSRAILDRKVGEEMNRHVCRGGHPSLLQRLEHYQAQGEIQKKVDLQKMSLSLCAHAFSLGFIAHLVFRWDRTSLLEVIQQSAFVYAQGLRPNDASHPFRRSATKLRPPPPRGTKK